MFWENVFGYNVDSLSDWDGRITPIIFVRGCNFKCPTCHNKHITYLISDDAEPVAKEFILNDIASKQNWYDGITISGGEVTLLQYLDDWILSLKEQFHLPVKLDSNGFLSERIIDLLEADVADFVAVDIKAPWELYPQLTGTDLNPKDIERRLKQIIKYAGKHTDKILFRTTMVPGLTDEHISIIKSYLPENVHHKIQPYRVVEEESHAI